MAIFAISDLHLSFGENKPMDVFGSRWKNYEERMRENWNKVVTNDDLVVIPGDISWAMYLQDTEADFAYIHSLNGQKLLLRGNHDYWWTTLNKMEEFVLEKGFSSIHFLKNTGFLWEDTAICGTRGWTIAHSGSSAEDKKIYERERQRMVLSLEDAGRLSASQILAAFHFPPVENSGVSDGFLGILQNYNVKECIFGHLHADSHKTAPQGERGGVHLRLVACDYLNFTPICIKK